MVEKRKLEKLQEVIEYTIPQNVDYNPNNGQYTIELTATKHINLGTGDYHTLFIKGFLKKDTISLSLVSKEEELLSVPLLPYIAHQGDRTPIYKIIRASALFANAMTNLTPIHRNLKKIPIEHIPLNIKDYVERRDKDIAFMKDLFKLIYEKNAYCSYQSVIIHKNAHKLKQAISYSDYEEKGVREKIIKSIEQLSPYIPEKDNASNMTPDIFVCEHMENSRDYFNCQVISLNSNNKSKEQFWWDYLKLNIFLSCLEYNYAYYILLNRWKTQTIQKWIAEYREKGLYEAERAKDNLVFYIKAGYKTSPRILNCNGGTIPTKVLNSYKKDC